MKTFLIFVLALVAVCHTAPTGKEDNHSSPIIPENVSHSHPTVKAVALTLPVEEPKHRQKRDEDAPSKPHSVIAHELLQHKPQDTQPAKPAGAVGHEALQHDPKKLKRESQSKPAAVAGREAVHHDGHSHTHDVLVPHSEIADTKTPRHQRDIPVPTEVKSKPVTTDAKDVATHVEPLPDHVPNASNDHPHSPLRHHPVTVSELFSKPKTLTQPSSSEEGKETKA